MLGETIHQPSLARDTEEALIIPDFSMLQLDVGQ
jgi:hypothetical protein